MPRVKARVIRVSLMNPRRSGSSKAMFIPWNRALTAPFALQIASARPLAKATDRPPVRAPAKRVISSATNFSTSRGTM